MKSSRSTHLAGAVVRTVCNGGVAMARRWRLWLVAAVLGAALALAATALMPERWVSRGEFAYRPVILWEGHLLAATSLNEYYALRLAAPDRVARATARAGITWHPESAELRVVAQPVPERSLVRLQVTAASPVEAERLARALLVDLRDEVSAANRQREVRDRLVTEISYTSFAAAAGAPPVVAALRGALAALAAALGLTAAAALAGRGRLRRPLETERVTGAPTLATIPGRHR